MLILMKVYEILIQVLDKIYRSHHSDLRPNRALAVKLVHNQIYSCKKR